MPALQVRDFPDDLYEELREYAASNHRSIAQQTIACVENELRRSKALKASGIEQEDGQGRVIELIPANVREAAERARVVDPFAWLDAFGLESEEAVGARNEKRERLRRNLAELQKHWKGPVPSTQEIVEMIREDRDGNHGHIVFGVDDIDESEAVG